MTIQYDIPIDDYHASAQLNTSKLSDFATRGPRYFAMRHVQRTSAQSPSTEAQVFGQAFEDLMCDPDAIAAKYAIKPEGMSFATKEGKAWKAEQTTAGRAIVDQGDLDAMLGMRESLWENETAVELIRAAKMQATIRAPYAGTPGIQSRPDWLAIDGCSVTGFEPFTLDLKTTIALAKLTSGRGVGDYRYHCQAALCRETLRLEGYATRAYLLACEKVQPYRCVVIEVTPDWLDAGWEWCSRQLGRLATHYHSGNWPRVPTEMVRLPAPPPWVANTQDDVDDEAA